MYTHTCMYMHTCMHVPPPPPTPPPPTPNLPFPQHIHHTETENHHGDEQVTWSPHHPYTSLVQSFDRKRKQSNNTAIDSFDSQSLSKLVHHSVLSQSCCSPISQILSQCSQNSYTQWQCSTFSHGQCSPFSQTQCWLFKCSDSVQFCDCVHQLIRLCDLVHCSVRKGPQRCGCPGQICCILSMLSLGLCSVELSPDLILSFQL